MNRQKRIPHLLALAVLAPCVLAAPVLAQEEPAAAGSHETPRAARGGASGDETLRDGHGGSAVSAAQPPDRLGAIGDSQTDEYFEEEYDYARGWTELLVEERGLSFGLTAEQAGQPGGTWREPRRTGYEDNWARYGHTIQNALDEGQHTGVANGVVNRGVSHVTIYLGTNDFSAWFDPFAYHWIYNGTWSQGDIDLHIAGRIAELEAMLDVVQPTGVSLVVLDIPDPSTKPRIIELGYTDPVRREAVAAAVGQFGAEIREMVRRRADRVTVFLDFFALGRAVFGTNLEPRETLLVGNVPIDLDGWDTASGGVPTAGFVHDRVHPNTVLQALWANAIVTALNLGYRTQLVPLSELEMLAAAGIPYGGSDTLEQEIGPLEAFVTVFIFTDGFESGSTSAWSTITNV
jgi:hypothetical protein